LTRHKSCGDLPHRAVCGSDRSGLYRIVGGADAGKKRRGELRCWNAETWSLGRELPKRWNGVGGGLENGHATAVARLIGRKATQADVAASLE